jgi:hypothetical protein
VVGGERMNIFKNVSTTHKADEACIDVVIKPINVKESHHVAVRFYGLEITDTITLRAVNDHCPDGYTIVSAYHDVDRELSLPFPIVEYYILLAKMARQCDNPRGIILHIEELYKTAPTTSPDMLILYQQFLKSKEEHDDECHRRIRNDQ